MHIRGNSNLSATSLYSAAAAEKSAANEQAREVRKKPIKSVATIEGTEERGEVSMIGELSEEDSRQRRSQGDPREKGGKVTEKEQAHKPFSIWA